MKFSNSKPFFHPTLLLLVACGSVLLLQSCGKDSVADSVTRQKDREREVANSLSKEYDMIAGDYKGQITSKVPVTVNDDVNDVYTIEATFVTVTVNKDGNIIPQPTVSGSINLINQSKKQIDANGKEIALVTPFPFQKGSYDKSKLRLTVEIQGPTTGNTAIYVACKKTSEQSTHFACHWQSIMSDSKFDFTLDKVQNVPSI